MPRRKPIGDVGPKAGDGRVTRPQKSYRTSTMISALPVTPSIVPNPEGDGPPTPVKEWRAVGPEGTISGWFTGALAELCVEAQGCRSRPR